MTSEDGSGAGIIGIAGSIPGAKMFDMPPAAMLWSQMGGWIDDGSTEKNMTEPDGGGTCSREIEGLGTSRLFLKAMTAMRIPPETIRRASVDPIAMTRTTSKLGSSPSSATKLFDEKKGAEIGGEEELSVRGNEE